MMAYDFAMVQKQLHKCLAMLLLSDLPVTVYML